MKKIFITMTLIGFISVLYSEQWQILGTRSMGMGGAYVAMAIGPIAQYWNPAGLAQISTQTFNGFEVSAGVGIETTGGLLSNISEITDVSKQIDAIKNTQDSQSNDKLDANQISAFVKTLGILGKMNEKEDSGALVEVAGGLNIKISKIALSVNNFTSVGLNPFIDTKNINIVKTGNAGGNIPTANTTDPGSQYDAAKQNLIQAIDIIGLSNIKSLLCGGDPLCETTFNNSFQNSQALAYTLINEAINNNLNPEDINKYSQEALKYADEAKKVVDNLVSGGSLDNNTSNLNVKAASFTEFSLGYAREANKLLTGLLIGGNLKVIRGDVGEKTFKFLEEDKTGDAFKNLNDYEKISVKPSLDMGFLWNVNYKYPKIPFRPRVGLTIRNINSPSFDGPNGKYKLDRQARFGVALSPFNWWHWALDIDLTKNSTPVDGFYSRQLSFGTEINIINRKSFNLPLRLGMMKNIAESDSKTIYTAGIGITFAYIHFETAVGISSGKQYIDGDKYPEKAQAVASLGILF
jgi:hypothetical protein